MLNCKLIDLNLDTIFSNGQTFRWRKMAKSNNLPTNISSDLSSSQMYWIGIARHQIWKIWRIDEMCIGFEKLHSFMIQDKDNRDDEHILSDYFQLDVDLAKLYRDWRKTDPYFDKVVTENPTNLMGIRILKQDSLESLIAFICSSNNNITRITAMVEKFCELYGTKHSFPKGTLEQSGVELENNCFHDFPSLQQLKKYLPHMENDLRSAGFGYRSAYIAQTVKALLSNYTEFGGGEEWLDSLRHFSYSEAKKALASLSGVGPKVADCICLMALSKHDVVPIDTHVLQITTQIYRPQFLKNLRTKTLSKHLYEQIGMYYTGIFGEYAGWAQSVLFSTRIKNVQVK